jgi:hypothetical protein
LQLITTGFPWIKAAFGHEAWTHCEVDLDLENQSYTVVINGSTVAANVPFLGRSDRLRMFQFDSFADGNDGAYLANFLFSATSIFWECSRAKRSAEVTRATKRRARIKPKRK